MKLEQMDNKQLIKLVRSVRAQNGVERKEKNAALRECHDAKLQWRGATIRADRLQEQNIKLRAESIRDNALMSDMASRDTSQRDTIDDLRRTIDNQDSAMSNQKSTIAILQKGYDGCIADSRTAGEKIREFQEVIAEMGKVIYLRSGE